MTIKELNRIVTSKGLTLISPTLFPKPTVGGVIATACHGTSRDAGNFSDDIIEMTVINRHGVPEKIDRSHPDFHAYQVSLGSLGVVYSVRLKLATQYNVRTEVRRFKVERVLAEFEDLRASNDFLEIFWWPFQDTMSVYCMNKTQAFPDKVSWLTRLYRRISERLQKAAVSHWLPWIAGHMPNLTPIMSTISQKIGATEGVRIQTASDAFHFQKVYPKCWDMSYAFPVDEAAHAWQTGIDLVNHYRDAGLYPVNLALHGRFTAGSEGWLAPDYQRQTGYVEAVTIEHTPNWKPFFQELEQRWLAIDGARPHWCKLYFDYAAIPGRYKHMERFREIRDRVDPDRIFSNAFLNDHIFDGPCDVSAPRPSPARSQPNAPQQNPWTPSPSP